MEMAWKQNAFPLKLLLVVIVTLLAGCEKDLNIPPGTVAGWPVYGATPGGTHFSRANQITTDNVQFLEKAWVHNSGDMREQDPEAGIFTSTAFEATPILIDDTLYYCSPFNNVFAVQAETGAEKWRFDAGVNHEDYILPMCRGVSSWRSGETGYCEHRIIGGTLDARLIALDAETGQPCQDFGEKGEVDLTVGLSEHPPREYSVTSPPAILGDLIITGSLVLDNQRVGEPSGVVRAYEARTGELRWAWNPVPPQRQQTNDNGTFLSSTTNVWSIIAVDHARNLVFVPTGNMSPDFYGGHRDGLDAYSSSVVALNGDTGELVWNYQFVHHDVWDYDTPAQPTLIELDIDGESVPALVQVTKMGLTFILNRETGEPLYPVEERPVPQNSVPGEYLSPTQPFPTHVPPLDRHTLSGDDAWGLTFWDEGKCKEIIDSYRNEGIYTPPSFEGSIFTPSNGGGNNWGSPAIDPDSKLMVVLTMHMPSVLSLIPREQQACNDVASLGSGGPHLGTPYCAKVMPILSPWSIPCTKPPWGTVDAVDLAAGEIKWRVPLGSLVGIDGLPGIGGPMITASGLVFVAGSIDPYLRALDASSGEVLWEMKLPTTANSVPMTYQLKPDGKQFVVVAAGGHWGGFSDPADHLMAFALPDPAGL